MQMRRLVISLISLWVFTLLFWFLVVVSHDQQLPSDSTPSDAFEKPTSQRSSSSKNNNDLFSEVPDVPDISEDSPSDSSSAEESALAPTKLYPLSEHRVGVVVMAYNRAKSLQRTLENINQLDGRNRFTLIVSQDGTDAKVAAVAKDLADVHFQRTDRIPMLGKTQDGHAYLAQHYKWALDRTFFTLDYDVVIVLEDDLDIALDFFTYFEATIPILFHDLTLFCVSAWNDNGYPATAKNPRQLYRTSFFPGLGWATTREVWTELTPFFPFDQWDNWMRVPGNVKNRDCIFPEVSRTYHVGSSGANTDGVFYSKYLKPIVLNTQSTRIDEFEQSASKLHPEFYEGELMKLIESGSVVESVSSLRKIRDDKKKVYVVPYVSEQFKQTLGAHFGIMSPPRGHWKYTTLLPWKGNTYVLVDRRRSSFCPVEYAIEYPGEMKSVAAQQGESCTSACSAERTSCVQQWFDFVNDCDLLRAAFSCPKGFGNEVGTDLPVYVPENVGDKNSGKCLWGLEPIYTCDAKFSKTRRLCPCK